MQKVTSVADGAICDFVLALHDGLSEPQKSIPSRFFYDAKGSALFEEITALDEYYPTRTELDILRQNADRIAADAGENCLLVEFGSGSSTKTEILLDKLDKPAGYVSIDISPTALEEAKPRLLERYPALRVTAVVADFSRRLSLSGIAEGARRVGFFPGSTIGNLQSEEAVSLLSNFRETLGRDSLLVVGVDLQKDHSTLLKAYNDVQGVTAAFNLNLLERANREARANFDLKSFRHEAIYNSDMDRIEMHLISLRDQEVTVAGIAYTFEKGETIHTENSHKYTLNGFSALCEKAQWRVERIMTDPDHMFGVFVLTIA
jgi:dimethylhistidine N-methyltransferase